MQVFNPPIGPTGSHIQCDVLTTKLPVADVAYLDPPYSSANYLTNYHIWETIARCDEPIVALKTHRRADLSYGLAKNPWCNVKTINKCFRTLLSNIDVRNVVLSYGSNSLITFDELRDIVQETHDIVENVEIKTDEHIMSKLIGKQQERK